eukprot:CAMPEP_0197074018 /NCGR_PEP_ID=MMETSP1384-20130603/210899_1 /TAXON_ID=29189 /ORGANISM="Ammonia sp." /LENGTH=319 /DNA_ID=CAMNT_0042512859 /DNA_START=10 /DNA_END=967 /DNA_ORIENTATION=-
MTNLASFVALPPMGVASVLFSVQQLYFTATLNGKQRTKPAAYSKFSKNKENSQYVEVGPRMGATLAYILPFIASSTFLCYQFYSRYYQDKAQPISLESVSQTLRSLTSKEKYVLAPTAMVFTHFLKRILECTFLHKYSAKNVRLVGALGISASYAMLNMGCMYFQNQAPSEYHETDGESAQVFGCLAWLVNQAPSEYHETRWRIGAGVWLLGLVGNLYHHYILSTLRKDAKSVQTESDNKKKYTIPSGGLFGYVWCPHYLFELMGWYGIAITSNTLNYWLMAGVYSSYLSGRAKSTEDWYLSTFEGDSQLTGNQRKAIL